jgi:methyltransferase
MELSPSLLLTWLLVLAVGTGRILELRLSRRRQHALAARGVKTVAEPHFAAMVVLHTGILLGAALEPWLTGQPPIPMLSAAAVAVVAGATALRLWVIAKLGPHWNVQVLDSLSLGVVSSGPFRWIRHPNYLAVFLELGALPLVHGAWLTAALGTGAHIWVLYHRIRTEEAALLAHPAYRDQMAEKPRFIPALRGSGASARRGQAS